MISSLLPLVLIPGLVGGQSVDDRPRILEDLVNGVKVRVQSHTGMTRARVVVFVGADPVRNENWPEGTAHLIEHLTARGDGKVDGRLENEAAYLSAFTGRSGTYYEIEGRSSDVSFLMTQMGTLFEPLEISEEGLKKEIGIIEQEKAVTPAYRWFDGAASESAFGIGGRGAFGDLEELRTLTVERVKEAFLGLHVGGNVSVYIEGDFMASSVMNRAQTVFGRLKKGSAGEAKEELLMETGRVRTAVRAKGEARSVIVPGLGNPLTMPRVAIGLAIAGRSGGKMVYEPGFEGGVVTVWVSEPGGLSWLDNSDDLTKFEILSLAQSYGQSYYRALAKTSVGRSRLEAQMLRKAGPLTMDTLDKQGMNLNQENLSAAYEGFKRANCIEVISR